MQIAPNSVVTLHYTVSTADGVELDSSNGKEPLTVIHGSQFLIAGLEEALEGRAAGDKFEVSVAPEKAYGERVDGLVQQVPKNMFEGVDVEVGMQFRATTGQGEQSVIVIDTDEDTVTVDGNHPLAGQELHFAVEVMGVRAATEEEIAHGHVHSESGCGHNH
jgi:FKBP-type peptidyl-prolyl cis-trans isomerase SlyD